MPSLIKRLAFVFTLIGANAYASAPTFLPTAPAGFKVSLLAHVPNARQIALSPKGMLYVGSMEAGQLSVVQKGQTRLLLSDLTYPTGVLWHKGDLYVAEISTLSVIRKVDEQILLKKPLKLEPLKTDFPKDLNHGWKYLAIGPDQKIYLPIGSPCNVCTSAAPYGAIHRLDLNGKKLETLAQGIRNSVGFTFHPQTQELWFTEMGRDMMGDNMPPDEINVLKIGGHYGFPYVHGKAVKDPSYHSQMPPQLLTIAPVGEIPAHSAPIGIVFTHGTPFAKNYPNCFFIALHGSWNRSKKSGYEVKVGCPKEDNQVAELRPFLSGFLNGETTLGRPVDLRFDANGALLVSDDHAGAIWRVEKLP